MDYSGNNRYELLFMDDDTSGPLIENVIKKKVKEKNQSVKSGEAFTAPIASSKQNARQQPKKKEMRIVEDGRKSSNTTDEKENKSEPPKKAITTSLPGLPANRKLKSLSSGGIQESKEQQNNRRNRENDKTQHEGEDADQKNLQKLNRERDSARGPPRHQHHHTEFGTGSSRGGKREFDRQSGSDKTGVKAVDKRDGAGAHNWGSVKQDIEDVNKPAEEETEVNDKEEPGNDLLTEPTIGNEETIELTLDEWKAQRQQRAKPQYNIRKAGEGENVAQWKKMIVLTNKKKDDESEEELEYDPSAYPQRVGRLQRVLDIQFRFKDGRRGGGGRGRGGRGGGGFGERGNERGDHGEGRDGGFERGRFDDDRGGNETNSRQDFGRPRNFDNQRQHRDNDKQRGVQNAPKVDDERQFPILC